MRKLMNAEVMEHTMRLRQMGADVQVINSKMCFVLFQVGEIDVAYCYNVNKKGRYFLERIKPYPLALREFEREQDVIDIIEIDFDQFRNASKSHNIENFIQINRMMHRTLRKFEDLFLYYNVPPEKADFILEHMREINFEIDKTKASAERVYFRKNPENL
ncbi:MAG: hypothetical protein PWP51_2496 [Clostridiales bacterium]|jgi:hypothetical protein|nr:hypothetical protein [Clostridiales bacterium]MDN5299943.1 hypothetical protein [Clostridiales bacterium]